jgi:hypothetical protein
MIMRGRVVVPSGENKGEVTTDLRMADGVTTVVRIDRTLRQATTIGAQGSFTMVVGSRTTFLVFDIGYGSHIGPQICSMSNNFLGHVVFSTI